MLTDAIHAYVYIYIYIYQFFFLLQTQEGEMIFLAMPTHICLGEKKRYYFVLNLQIITTVAKVIFGESSLRVCWEDYRPL